jgi:hypothetical protein
MARFDQGIQPGNEQFMLFFHIKTKELWSGARQNMSFLVSQLRSPSWADPAKAPDVPDGYFMQIRDAKGNVISATPGWDDSYKVPWSGKVVPEEAGDYYLVVYRRWSPVKRPTAYVRVTWASDLRTIDLTNIWSNAKLFMGFGATASVDNQAPYWFDFGTVAKHQSAGWPAPDPAKGNALPLDQHEINIADNLTIQPMLPGIVSGPVTLHAIGATGDQSIDLVPGLVTLKFNRN